MLTHCLTQTGRLLGCHAYFRKINYTPYGAGTHPLNVFSVLARSATAQPACSSGWGAAGQALRRPQESGGSRPCQRAPIPLSIHQPPPRESHCSRPAGSRREGPGWRCRSTGLALACLWRPSGPCMGKPGPVPMWMAVPTPDSPLSPICSSGASGCPARGDGQRARPRTRAGSQAQPARLKPQPGAPGLCPPRPAGAETHLGIQVANHRDKLRNDK